MEDLPVLEVWVFLTCPEEHRLWKKRWWEQAEFPWLWEEEQGILGKLDSPGIHDPLPHQSLGLT